MFAIESSEPRFSTCDCCDGTMTNLTGFVTKDDNAFAIYYATLSQSHPESGVMLAIGIDDDWSEIESSNRVAFAFWLHTTDEEYRISITDKAESPWNQSKLLGRMLDRNEALEHLLLDEVYQLIAHIVEEDETIKELFDGATIH